MRPFYVTTPIYYVNDLPHIGHIFTTLAADTLARYRRLCGDDVYFLTGTDEHGQKIQRAAETRGLEPQRLADQVVSRYQELWRLYGVSHDDFLRTTEARHRRGVEALIGRLAAAGDLYAARHEGWYCTAAETFYTEKELLPGRRCPDTGEPAEWRSEENVFFRLSRYQRALLEWYERHPDFVRPESRLNEVRAFVAGGLNDLSVSRAGLAWGIPFPDQPGQTTYVWLDALTNYISALGFGDGGGGELYRRLWEAEDAVKVHLIGKDILRFHAVFWPAFLMSAGLPLPSTVWAHGWWLRDDRKISKSVGNVVRPDALVASFGPDALRYALFRDMVFGQDAHFSDEAVIDRFNADLANDLGNSVSRLVTLSRRAFAGRTPPFSHDESPLRGPAEAAIREYRAAMEELAFQRALAALWRLLAEASQYLVAGAPWHLVKSEGPSERVARILWNGLESIRVVATGLLPFLPHTAPRLLQAVGVEEVPASLRHLAWGGLPSGRELPEPQPLFPRIDKAAWLGGAEAGGAAPTSPSTEAREEVEKVEKVEKPLISIEQFRQVDLRVATVTAAEAVPKADRLLKLRVDLGGEERTLVAGIAENYRPEDLVGKQVVVVANLQPATLRGVESQGMLLAAEVEGRAVLVLPIETVPAGSPVK